jgi:probable HAF family extracellular repeat protein
MKLSTRVSMSAVSLLTALILPIRPAAQEHSATHHGNGAPRYTVADLGSFTPNFVADNGVVAGLATAPDGTQHAVLWYQGRRVNIAKPGLGGANSGAFGVNEIGQVGGQAETNTKDPNNENFCGYGTGLKCVPFLWQDGVMTRLRTLGGNNGTAGVINKRGEMAGIAENRTRDPECVLPQVLDFQGVIWGPGPGDIRELAPLPGDSVGVALGINDKGQAVGGSGRCGNTILPPLATAPHAVLWDKDGSAHDLGSLGGTDINMALSLNNHGQVVGASAPPGGTSPLDAHAFLWTRETDMRDLGTLPGDVASFGSAINDDGDVVGGSFDADGNPRAFVWKNGVMHSLNDPLIAPDSPLFVLIATAINARGEIVGFGATGAGAVHGFLATPRGSDHR